MRAGSLKRHAPICIKNPTAFARYCEVLASAPGSKQGITCGHYVQLSTADKTLPTVITLRRLAGSARWEGVLAVFGLEPPAAEQQRSQCAHCGKFVGAASMAGHLQECKALQPKAPPPPKPPRKPMNVLVPRKQRTVPPPQTCPQCGVQRINMERHVCPEDPAVVAWLTRVLPDPADPGRMITCREYRELPDKAIAQNIIDNLDEKYKDIIVLRYLEEKEYEEISDILQLPLGTVSTLIHRGKKEMQKTLQKYI
jgi:RNA polymerase sigma-70 factor (ECF subfamily)